MRKQLLFSKVSEVRSLLKKTENFSEHRLIKIKSSKNFFKQTAKVFPIFFVGGREGRRRRNEENKKMILESSLAEHDFYNNFNSGPELGSPWEGTIYLIHGIFSNIIIFVFSIALPLPPPHDYIPEKKRKCSSFDVLQHLFKPISQIFLL